MSAIWSLYELTANPKSLSDLPATAENGPIERLGHLWVLNEIIGESLDRADPGILGRPVRDLAEREIGDSCGATDFPPLLSLIHI